MCSTAQSAYKEPVLEQVVLVKDVDKHAEKLLNHHVPVDMLIHLFSVAHRFLEPGSACWRWLPSKGLRRGAVANSVMLVA